MDLFEALLRPSAAKSLSSPPSKKPTEGSFEVLVDDRERFVIDEFKTLGLPPDTVVRQQRLNAGDFAIAYRGHVLFLLERKTWADLAATIKDASRRNNYTHLTAFRTEHPETVIGYLIEGPAFPNPKNGVGQVSYAALVAHLDHRVIEDRFAIFHTPSPRATAERILALLKNYTSLKSNRIKEINTVADGASVVGGTTAAAQSKNETAVLSKPRHKSDAEVSYAMLCSIPGVTELTAGVLTDAGIGLRDILEKTVDREAVAQLRFASGMRVGPSRASRILGFSASVVPKILACIPLISSATAALIVSEFDLEQLLSMTDETEQAIANLKKGARRIGPAAASNVRRLMGTKQEK